MPKFTLEQLIESINGKFTNKEGKTSLKLSERTVKETLAPIFSLAGEDTELENFVKDVAFPIIDSANKNYIKDVSDFTKNYKPTPSPTPTPTPPTTDPDILKRLEAMEEFSRQYAKDQKDLEDKRKYNELSGAVKKALIEQGCSVDLIRENAIYKIGIQAEKSVDDNVKAIKESYDSILSQNIQSGVIPQMSVAPSLKVLSEEEHAKQAAEIGKKLNSFH